MIKRRRTSPSGSASGGSFLSHPRPQPLGSGPHSGRVSGSSEGRGTRLWNPKGIIRGVFELRRAGPDDAETMAETVRLGFASFRAWAGPEYDPPPSTIEPPKIREGLARPRPGRCWRSRAASPPATSAIT